MPYEAFHFYDIPSANTCWLITHTHSGECQRMSRRWSYSSCRNPTRKASAIPNLLRLVCRARGLQLPCAGLARVPGGILLQPVLRKRMVGAGQCTLEVPMSDNTSTLHRHVKGIWVHMPSTGHDFLPKLCVTDVGSLHPRAEKGICRPSRKMMHHTLSRTGLLYNGASAREGSPPLFGPQTALQHPLGRRHAQLLRIVRSAPAVCHHTKAQARDLIGTAQHKQGECHPDCIRGGGTRLEVLPQRHQGSLSAQPLQLSSREQLGRVRQGLHPPSNST